MEQQKNFETPVNTQLPNYREIVKQIGQQLNARKGLIFLRVLFTLLPVLLAFGILFLFGGMGQVSGDSFAGSKAVVWIGLLIVFFMIISPWWMLVVGHIFKVERIIWIDSFFDKVPLEARQSWKLAKRLFWPSVGLDLVIFIRYYLLFSLVMLGAVGTYIYLLATGVVPFQKLPLLLGLAATVAVIWSYVTYTQIKLRYVWFLFIDLYGQDNFSYRRILQEMKKLNEVMKQEAFKKLLVTALGVDTIAGAANILIGTVSQALSQPGSGGKATGFYVNTIGGEYVAIANDYAKQVAYYMFYSVARASVYGDPQLLNSSLYSQVSVAVSSSEAPAA